MSPATENAEHQWIDALARSGDEAAFRQLYRRHTPRLYGFVLRLTGGAEAEAEDVVQETWTRAVKKLGDFRGRSAFSTWLFGIASNLCREERRQKRRRDEKEGAVVAPTTTDAAPRGLRLDLGRALAELPERCRAVLLLHDLEGYTHEEIAREMGISAGTSKSQLFEARRRVRTSLRGETP